MSVERRCEPCRGVTLRIQAGEYVSIMGPSGSGKSTLLHLLGCLDRPTAGSYRFAGRETAGLAEAELSRLRRHQIGFVFQFFHLMDGELVRDAPVGCGAATPTVPMANPA